MTQLHEHTAGYLVILIGCILLEGFIVRVSSQGSMTDVSARKGIEVLLYLRLFLLVIELVWLILGTLWLTRNYTFCFTLNTLAKDAILGITITNWFVLISVLITLLCSFDWTGSYSVSQVKRRRSVSIETHDQRQALSRRVSRSDFESKWGHRCWLLTCCLNPRDRQHGSLVQIVNLLSEMFDDSSEDVVPTDIIAGLILLRRLQTLRRDIVVSQETNDIYQFLSGVGITPSSKFVDINDPLEVDQIQELIHFMQYCLASYGWPLAAMALSSSTHASSESTFGFGCCLCPLFSCSKCKCQTAKCCPSSSTLPPTLSREQQSNNNYRRGDERLPNTSQQNQSNLKQSNRTSTPTTTGDNLCHCNQRAFEKLSTSIDCELIYAKYSARVGEPSFSVIVDHDRRCVVVCVRGTFSLEDLITDLNAVSEVLPLNPLEPSWTGHRGMVFAAEFVKRELFCRDLLKRAFGHRIDRGTASYQLILVGHSLGAGVACILSVLLRPLYPELHCYAFSPPGGLFSRPVIEYSRNFITSVILGKDVVPRLGLHSVQVLTRDLLAAISSSTRPKWKIIGYSCCLSSSSSSSSFLTEKERRKRRKVLTTATTRRPEMCLPSYGNINNNPSLNMNNASEAESIIEERTQAIKREEVPHEEQHQSQDVKITVPDENQSESDGNRLQSQASENEEKLDKLQQEIRGAIEFWKSRDDNGKRKLFPNSQKASSGIDREMEDDASCAPLLPSSSQQERDGVSVADFPAKKGIKDKHEILLPPGNIIHILRSHPERNTNQINSTSYSDESIIYQALYVNNDDFDEVLISPVMLHDHLPHNVLRAMESLLTRSAPPKPSRLPSYVEPSSTDYTRNTIYQPSTSIHHHRSPPSAPLPPPPPSSPVTKVIAEQPQSQHHVYASIGTASSSNNINNFRSQQQQLQGPHLKYRTPTPTETLIDTLSVSSKLVIETSFTDLRPSSTTDGSTSCYYGSGNGAAGGSYGKSLMNGYNYYSNGSMTTATVGVRNNSSLRPSFLSALRHHRKHDLFRHDWMRPAPLASPENSCLTDTSSLMSRNMREETFRQQSGHEFHVHNTKRTTLGTNEMSEERQEENDDRLQRMRLVRVQEDPRRRSEDCYAQVRKPHTTRSEDRGGSRLSLQELIDVFSECSDSRSLEDMVEEAKRVLTPSHV